MRLENQRATLVALTIALAGVASCEIAATVAPDITPRPVVHSVLNPGVTQQIVLVERTRQSNGNVGSTPTRAPITNARVVVYGPRQDSVIATQSAGASDGVYRFQSTTVTDGSAGQGGPNVLRIRPGERYRLKVETSIGTATGETIVPIGGAPDVARRSFNLDRDTLQLRVSVSRAAGFLLRHETRLGVIEQFMTKFGEALILPLANVQGDPDDAEWGFEFAQSYVYPGYAQRFVVIAVDSNYFRYNVAGFDPFGDDTPGNSLTGGVGVFGAVATLMFKTLDLTATIDTPIEGAWTADRNSPTLPLGITLYSSPYFPRTVGLGNGDQTLSGGAVSTTGRSLDALGGLSGISVQFQFTDPASPDQPVAATGLLNGNILELTDSRTKERVTYRKR
jgi:hypothetical protein